MVPDLGWDYFFYSFSTTCSRERRAKDSCCVRILLGSSCTSRPATRWPSAEHPVRIGPIEILHFAEENPGFGITGPKVRSHPKSPQIQSKSSPNYAWMTRKSFPSHVWIIPNHTQTISKSCQRHLKVILVYMYVHVHTYVYLFTYVCMHACMYVHTLVYRNIV